MCRAVSVTSGGQSCPESVHWDVTRVLDSRVHYCRVEGHCDLRLGGRGRAASPARNGTLPAHVLEVLVTCKTRKNDMSQII